MFSKEDIMKMMQSGKTAEDIAAEFATALNEAETETKRIDEEAREKAEAEALLAARKAEKIEDMRYIINAVFDYFHEWYPELDAELHEAIKDLDDDEEIEEVIEAIDAYVNMMKSLTNLKNLMASHNTTNNIHDIKDNSSKSVNFDIPVDLSSIFNDFFKENNI